MKIRHAWLIRNAWLILWSFSMLLPAGCASAPPASPAHPGPRASHDLVHHPRHGETLLVGNSGSPDDPGHWAWDEDGWRVVEAAQQPAGRWHSALVHDPGRRTILLHGGFLPEMATGGAPEVRSGDLWAWDEDGWRRVHDESVGPGPRDHHDMVHDAARGEVLLFAGNRGRPQEQRLLGDTWILDADSWRRHDGYGPPARSTHRMVYDSGRQRVVLFGGYGEAGFLGDTWEWDGETWTPVADSAADGAGPSPRFATRLAYDPGRGRTVLFGGRNGDGNLGDTWEWDGERWERAAEDGPGPRNVHAMVFDARLGEVVLYGGIGDDGRLGDLWSWNGRRWRRLEPPADPPAAVP